MAGMDAGPGTDAGALGFYISRCGPWLSSAKQGRIG